MDKKKETIQLSVTPEDSALLEQKAKANEQTVAEYVLGVIKSSTQEQENETEEISEKEVFSRNMQFLRNQRGFNLGDVANKVRPKVARITVRKWDKGSYIPTDKNMRKLERLFNVEKNALLDPDFIDSFNKESLAKEQEKREEKESETNEERQKELNTLSKNLTYLREKSGLSRHKISTILKGQISEASLFNWEKGTHIPYPTKMKEIAKFYQVEPDDLLNKDFSSGEEIIQPEIPVKEEQPMVEETMNYFSENVRYLKEAYGLKSSDLSKMLSFSPSPKEIFHWEKGDQVPSIDKLEIISNFFNIPIKELFSKSLKSDILED